MLTRLGPPLTVLLLAGPIVAGLLGTILPAFGYLPALGGVGFSFDPFRQLFGQPGIWMSVLLSLATGLATTAVSLTIVLVFVAGFAGTRLFGRVQHLISPLLSVPHAAAAFGLAFLIAPSGMIARMLSPELTGWERPPDLLIVNDPMGLVDDDRADRQGNPVPAVDHARRAAAGRSRALAAALGLARLRPYRRFRLRAMAADLSADQACGVCGRWPSPPRWSTSRRSWGRRHRRRWRFG